MKALDDIEVPVGQPAVIRRPAAIDWRLLNYALGTMEREIQQLEARRAAAAELLTRVVQAEYVAWLGRDAGGQLQFLSERTSALFISDSPRSMIAAEFDRSLAMGGPAAANWKDEWSLIVCALADGATPGVAIVVPASLPAEMVGAVLQLVLLGLFGRQPKAETSDEQAQLNTTAAALELTSRLTSTTDLKAAGRLICDLVRRQLGVERVALGTMKRSRMIIEPIAISDVAEVDKNTAAVKLLGECLTESLAQPALVRWSQTGKANPLGLSHWPQLAETWQAQEMVAVRLSDRADAVMAVCLVPSRHPIDAKGEQFLRLVANLAGPLLRVLERAAQGHRLHDLKESWPKWLKGRRACAVAALVAMPLLYPWATRTTCAVTLEPTARRLVAAPFEGVFDHSLVLPGDRVQAGQALGYMDGREVRTRLAACEAELNRAAKSRDVNLAAGKLGPAEIDRLEAERLGFERRVYQGRLKKLEIRSPVAGVVVTGDLRQYEAATLKVGQTLYEVAPLDSLKAELAVPEAELEQVAIDADMSLWLDAVPGERWDLQIARIHPRGELRDNQQVFIAETTLQNESQKLQPGMQGTATVYGPRAPGLWLLLRKPWFLLCRFCGW
ncbi:MAG: efflux RND transporter periplasmic adaptor subunit [Planctomycetes bacterium]|nr:efflux RND transporter periplasmic adaptor subunit [Planctomycetota bacterium]